MTVLISYMKLRILKSGEFALTSLPCGTYYIGATTYKNRDCLSLVPGYSRDRILPDVRVQGGKFKSITLTKLLEKLNSDRSYIITDENILVFNKTIIN